MMPAGPILLTLLAIFILFGFTDPLLHRFGLSVRAALILVLAMLGGAFFEIPVGRVLTLNLGGVVIPAALAIYLTATSPDQTGRVLFGTLACAVSVFMVGRMFPPWQPTELNLFHLDAQYLFALVGGAVGFLAGATRRAAFAASVFGVLAADLLHLLRLPAGGTVTASIGGGGFQMTAVVAGLLALGLVEWIGEARVRA